MPTLLLHIANEEPVLGEVDQLPGPGDTLILVKNPRKRDGKDISALDASVSQVFWPVNRIIFIEIMPGDRDEEIISHFRG